MERAVLLTVDADIYDDGIFLDKLNWNKVEKNMLRLQTEIKLLRLELSKFEKE